MNELESHDSLALEFELRLWESFGEDVGLLDLGGDVLHFNLALFEMFPEPMVLDCNRLGARSHSRRVLGRENVARLVVFKDIADVRLAVKRKTESLANLLVNATHEEQDAHAARTRDVLGLHGREGNLGLQL